MLAATVALLASAPSRAAAGGSIVTVTVGFDGRARTGAWTPVWVEVVAPAQGLDGTLTVTTASPAGGVATRYAVPVRAGPGATVRVFLPAVFHNARAPGVLTLDDAGGGHLARVALPRLRPVDEVVLALSRAPLNGARWLAGAARAEVVYLPAEHLPPVWQAYEAVRLVVVRDLDERRVDDDQRRALHQWVLAGGRLVAMPSDDDVRVLAGPTLRPLLPAVVRTGPRGEIVVRPVAGARVDGPPGARVVWAVRGRGHVVLWEWDGSRPTPADAVGGAPGAMLQAAAPAVPPELEGTLPPARPLPLQVQVGAAALVLAYIVAVRRLSSLAAGRGALGLLTACAVTLLAAAGALVLAGIARRAASGPVASVVVEHLPGTDSARVLAVVRTVAAPGSTYVLHLAAGALVRPATPIGLTVVRRPDGADVIGADSARLVVHAMGSGRVRGTIDRAYTRAVIQLANGLRLERAWIHATGRVHPLPAVAGRAVLALDASRWTTRDRLARTEPNHALLVWAFSLLESDAILKAHPAWLLGWMRDPAFSLRWNGRVEVPWQLVLAPLGVAD